MTRTIYLCIGTFYLMIFPFLHLSNLINRRRKFFQAKYWICMMMDPICGLMFCSLNFALVHPVRNWVMGTIIWNDTDSQHFPSRPKLFDPKVPFPIPPFLSKTAHNLRILFALPQQISIASQSSVRLMRLSHYRQTNVNVSPNFVSTFILTFCSWDCKTASRLFFLSIAAKKYQEKKRRKKSKASLSLRATHS